MLEAKLVAITGGMFVGKSTELIAVGEKYKRAGYHVLYVKPKIDSRYSEDHIVTHNGEKVQALSTEYRYDMLNSWEYIYFDSADVILIDEIQFFTEAIVEELEYWINQGKLIYVAGLDLDYNAKPFYVTSQVMAIADEVHKRKTVCNMCSNPSYVSLKRSGSSERIELGSSDIYSAVCRECYNKEQERY